AFMLNLRSIAGWASWGLALWGVLKLRDVPLLAHHGVCGPWGCGPPVQTLIACHLGWLVELSPVAVLVPMHLSTVSRRVAGWTLIAVGLVRLAALSVYEALTWLPHAPPFMRSYYGHRCLFSVATMTDAPIVQLIILGVVFLIAGQF